MIYEDPLRYDTTVSLDGFGAAVQTIGPVPFGEKWHCTTISVRCSDTITPTMIVTRNSPNGAFIDGTSDCSFNVTTVEPMLLAGETLWFTFTGGAGNGSVGLSIEGTIDRQAA